MDGSYVWDETVVVCKVEDTLSMEYVFIFIKCIKI